MSTFRGIVSEFPQIRIDYFRQQPVHKAPLACFLSHVHSDHLAGLESLKAPFVYCSAATREILLRLEKYRYRVDLAKGLLESRYITYDRSMRRLAKPLPLETPTVIELAPGNSIRVTCIDANHCVGAVMFLIEGNDKAILYTGDIRAETWWVNSLVQNPILLPYTLGPLWLSCIYLDTTFASKSEPYREFPSKAAGLQELLGKVSEYPDDTIFYFNPWTFGYENVWIALSAFLNSRIHVDNYRARIYGALSMLNKHQLREAGLEVSSDNKFFRDYGHAVREAPALCGFQNGNHIQPGCLTSLEDVRIHSCERGMGCSVIDCDTNANVVHIIPIISRANGVEIAEIGAGGGKGDLDQKDELETADINGVGKMMELCAASIGDPNLLAKVLGLLQSATNGHGNLEIDIDRQKQGPEIPADLSLQDFVNVLSSHASKDSETKHPQNRTIRFPYSRHSSYSELRSLVETFRPMDVFPCTVDDTTWTPLVSMRVLFGDLCSGDTFRHDSEMMVIYGARLEQDDRAKRDGQETQRDTQYSDDDVDAESPATSKRACLEEANTARIHEKASTANNLVAPKMMKDNATEIGEVTGSNLSDPVQAGALFESRPECSSASLAVTRNNDISIVPIPAITSNKLDLVSSNVIGTGTFPAKSASRKAKKMPRLSHQELAYNAAIGKGLTWSDYGGLVSTRSKADREEPEL